MRGTRIGIKWGWLMTKESICIYHGGCDDGFGAAYAVWKRYGDRFEYYSGVYQNDPPDVTGKDVLLVDFSYKRPVIEAMAKSARRILILDHHKSAIEDLHDFSLSEKNAQLFWGCQNLHELGIDYPYKVAAYFNMNQSGAVIAWCFFHNDFIPELFMHIQDRDLWKLELPGTKEISMALRSFPHDFQTWDEIMDIHVETLRHEGAAINRWFNLQTKKLKRHAIPQTIGGYEVPTVNAPLMFASDLAGELSEGYPFAACYFDLPEGRVYSLRSHEGGIDVSEIAKKYGGGGHKGAAGFRLPYGKVP